MIRALILALARSRLAERLATRAPGLRGFARRFVAGEEPDDALAAVRRLNDDGFHATVSLLGEAVASRRDVEAATAEIVRLVEALASAEVRSGVSVKLTHLGLAIDRELTAHSLDELLRAAERHGMFVRVDMEDSRYTQPTLELVREARRAHPNVGAVLQAYLHRTDADVVALAREGVPVRLVKGAYREPPRVAYQSRREVDLAFARQVDAYFASMSDGASLAVGTHDERMVRAALASAQAREVTGERFEFQMLYGIRTDLQRRLRDEGHRVRVYVPYGSHWYPYLMRRLAERPANLWFFLRNAFRR